MSVYQCELPKARIASWPAARSGTRDSAKLLVVESRGARGPHLADNVFSELPSLLRAGDLLVLNDTAVVPRRFFAKRAADQREFELLLVKRANPEAEIWEALGRPLAKIKSGDTFELAPGVTAEVCGRTEDSRRLLLKVSNTTDMQLDAALDSSGYTPIPPYIRGGRSEQLDRELYQTVYSSVPGSIAAPTAGLHFTEALLERILQSGVRIGYLTHHVSTASFQDTEDDASFRPDVESYMIPSRCYELIQSTKASGGRVICVGTTGCRALESFARDPELQQDAFVETSLFITPGHEFKLVDILITNFHQPKSTHMHLVSAFCGEELIRAAYEHGLQHDYRFLSYGDAMLLAPGGLQ